MYQRLYQGNFLRGILVATDRGLFIGPAIGDNQPWIPTSQFYTTTPIRFQADTPETTMLGSANNVFPLVSDFFYYLPSEPGTTPTVMPTPSPTATPELSATPGQPGLRDRCRRGGWPPRRIRPGTAHGWFTAVCAACAPGLTAPWTRSATPPVTRMSLIPAGVTDATLSFWWHPISAEGSMAAAAAVAPDRALVQAVLHGEAPEGLLAGDLQYVVLADQKRQHPADDAVDPQQRTDVAMGQLPGVQVPHRPHGARAVRRL